MKVCVTGGTGFIASYVIEELLAAGHQVVTNVRHDGWQADPVYKGILDKCEVYKIDVRDQSGMYHMIERTDGVIHLAAILGTRHVENGWNFYETNTLGTINVLESCKELGLPVVVITVGNYFEHNNYSNSKVAAEREVLKYAKYCGVKANVVRALNAIGGRQKVKNTGKIMSSFVTAALKDEPLNVYGGKDKCSIMDMVYVGDVAKVLVRVFYDTALDAPCGRVFEAGTGVGYSVYELAQKVISMTNSKSQIVEVPMRSGESERSHVVAREPYPIEYREIEDVIRETINFYRMHQ